MRMFMPIEKNPWINGHVLTLNNKNFDAIYIANKPVVVDFWAEWCRPCMAMKPVFEAMASDYSDRLFFASINVDQNQSLAQRYNIMSIPNFCIFKDGKLIDRVIGSVGQTGLKRILDKYV